MPPPDGEEQTTFVTERAHPAELRQPRFRQPVVGGGSEQVFRLFTEDRARIGAQVFDAVLRKPALHFRDGMTMLFRVLILIAQPRVAPSRLAGAIAQDGVERHESETRQPRRRAPQAR